MQKHFLEQISVISGAKVLGTPEVGVFGILLKDHDCVDVCGRLSSEFSIATRAGLHCAPMAHRTLGTITKGLLRFSIGYFNTKEEITEAISALEFCLKN